MTIYVWLARESEGREEEKKTQKTSIKKKATAQYARQIYTKEEEEEKKNDDDVKEVREKGERKENECKYVGKKNTWATIFFFSLAFN